MRPLDPRAPRLLASFTVLLAICACGGSRRDRAVGTEEAPPEGVAEAAPSGPVTLPDALMPLTEGGVVEPVAPDSQTLTTAFPAGEFEAIRSRVTTWMPANGWTLVQGSEVTAESAAATLEEMGMAEAAALARSRPVFGSSYQRDGHTVAVNLDSIDGTLRLSLNWF